MKGTPPLTGPFKDVGIVKKKCIYVYIVYDVTRWGVVFPKPCMNEKHVQVKFGNYMYLLNPKILKGKKSTRLFWNQQL